MLQTRRSSGPHALFPFPRMDDPHLPANCGSGAGNAQTRHHPHVAKPHWPLCPDPGAVSPIGPALSISLLACPQWPPTCHPGLATPRKAEPLSPPTPRVWVQQGSRALVAPRFSRPLLTGLQVPALHVSLVSAPQFAPKMTGWPLSKGQNPLLTSPPPAPQDDDVLTPQRPPGQESPVPQPSCKGTPYPALLYLSTPITPFCPGWWA